MPKAAPGLGKFNSIIWRQSHDTTDITGATLTGGRGSVGGVPPGRYPYKGVPTWAIHRSGHRKKHPVFPPVHRRCDSRHHPDRSRRRFSLSVVFDRLDSGWAWHSAPYSAASRLVVWHSVD